MDAVYNSKNMGFIGLNYKHKLHTYFYIICYEKEE